MIFKTGLKNGGSARAICIRFWRWTASISHQEFMISSLNPGSLEMTACKRLEMSAELLMMDVKLAETPSDLRRRLAGSFTRGFAGRWKPPSA